MRRIYTLFVLPLLLCGCTDTTTIDQAIAAQSAAQTQPLETTVPSAWTTASMELPDSSNGEINVDLTTLSGNLVYAQVYDMTTAPDKYIGQKVRMKGTFAYFRDDTEQKDYFAVLIADALACCSQGIEFVLAGDAVYPEDYPPLDTIITVSGVFGSYEEDGQTYCQLTDAVIESTQAAS